MKKAIAILMMLSLVSTANAAVAVYNTTYATEVDCECNLVSVFTKKCKCKVNTSNDKVMAMCEAGFRNNGYELTFVDSNKSTLKDTTLLLVGSFFTLVTIGLTRLCMKFC
ncbi:MAG: hypothetical protein LBV62_02680 [Rickettsiales bacterium]|jgi:hypothetical protein|nr:hypothetical protein [Rickettsiales bacterium]